MKEKWQKLKSNVNFWRALVVYLMLLAAGIIGFFAVRGTWGWYFLTCLPGLGIGIGLALLNNGHRKPVTFKSVGMTILMTALLTIVMWYVSGELFPALLGWGFSVIGGFLGLWFCKWENKRFASISQTAPPH